MEGVQNKFAIMLYNTWLIHSIELTNNILDNGEKPAVISAIMKQQIQIEQEMLLIMEWIYTQEVRYVLVAIILWKSFIEVLLLVLQ